MGAKSTNVITTKQMLPLFQVISDLEKPYDSNTSLQTQPSSYYYENRSILSESQDIVIHHHEKSDNFSSEDFYPRGDYIDRDGRFENVSHLANDYTDIVKREDKRRNKKRRRLKEGGAVKYSYVGRKHLVKHRGHHFHKNMDIYYKSSQHHPVKSTDNTDCPETSTPREHRIGKKKTGLFTTMSLNMYEDDGVDLSRHFKDLPDGDLNSENEGPTAHVEHSDCPTYEVPKDIIVKSEAGKLGTKKGHQRCATDTEDRGDSRERRRHSTGQNKMNSKEIIKKYEEMLTILIEKCQEKDSLINSKDKYIAKIKSKLKQVLDYNTQFAEENDCLKKQHADLMLYLEQQKVPSTVASVKETEPAAAPEQENLVCASCAANGIVTIRSQRENARLNEDIVMLKNVVYRLNIQLSRYQDKLRNARIADANLQNIASPQTNVKSAFTQRAPASKTAYAENTKETAENDKENNAEAGLSIPPLPTFMNTSTALSDITDLTNQYKKNNNAEDHGQQLLAEQMRGNFVRQNAEQLDSAQYDGRLVWGDVNTHTLAPLLNAYQQSLTEKDDLIRDYEHEFNRFSGKLREVVAENANLHSASQRLAAEATSLRSTCGLAQTERDQLRRDCRELNDKSENLETKLKEVHECYEQKVESMSRDYTLVHREYSQARVGLAGALGRCQALQRQVHSEPSGHNIQVEECKRLLEELKQRYNIEKSKLSMRLGVLQDTNAQLEKRLMEVSTDRHSLEAKVKHADKVIRRWRRDVLSLRGELAGARSSRDSAKRRATKATALCRQLAAQLQSTHSSHQLQHAKAEKMSVQKEALKELDAVEDRMKEQDRNMENIKEQSGMEISRLENLLMEREATIEAMKRHMSGERLQRYAGHKLPSHKIPDDLIKARALVRPPEIKREPPPKPVRSDLPAGKGGFFIQKDKSRGAASKDAENNQ